jgi:hypothetical protein
MTTVRRKAKTGDGGGAIGARLLQKLDQVEVAPPAVSAASI